MDVYTIGFTKKKAKDFFSILKENGVRRIIDVRLNNNSQLAGFTKQDDLSYFLKEINNIEYRHESTFAPSKELLKAYQNKEIDWHAYENEYNRLLIERKVLDSFDISHLENACLLCSEATPEKCHRRLLAEYFAKNNKGINITHL